LHWIFVINAARKTKPWELIMKSLILSVFAMAVVSSNVMAAERNYQCIADALQAYNSDIYYNLSSTEIDAMITIPEMFGHIDAVNAEKRCDAERLAYQCVSDALQAYNSSVYYNLSKEDIDTMISIPEMFGHFDAVKAAKRCGLL
jgi:hypothetical protein